MAIVPLVTAGLGVAQKLLSKNKHQDIRGAIARLRASRPVGYLTPEDNRAAELTRGRLMRGVQDQGQLAGYEIGRRAQARGLAGSPSEERDRSRLQQQVLQGTERAGEASEEQLYNIRTGREAFERQKALDIFGAETNNAARENERLDAQNGEFWNSLNEFIPTITAALGKSKSNPGAIVDDDRTLA